MSIKETQVNHVLANLQEFDVKKVNIENDILKLSIQIKSGSDIETYEKIIKNRFQKYKVQITFFTQKNEGKTFKKIIGISSGKGGVGKSIIALNLAFCLRDLGYKVSILDADIYSPSIPGMLDVHNNPPISNDGSTIEPIKTRGLELLSMGLFLQDNQSPIWQESTLDGAFRQFLVQGNWSGDYLIIDFAGGMSCLYNSCMQLIPNIEILLVGIPNRMVYRDVLRMYALLKAMGMNVKGTIDNMSDSFYDATKFIETGFNLQGLEKISAVPYFKKYLNLIENGYPEDHKLTYDFDTFKKIVDKLL